MGRCLRCQLRRADAAAVARDDDQAGDPFAGLSLDEDFVRAACKHEAPAAERAERAARARAAHAELVDQRRRDRESARLHRRALRKLRRWRSYVPAVIVVGALAGVATLQGGGTSEAAWLSGRHVVLTVGGGDRPTPQAAASEVPLGIPAATPAGGGRHLFSATQPGSAEPVTYDPCRPITVVVNARTAPSGSEGVLAEALEQISALTGLHFEVEGATDEAPLATRPAFLPVRYGDRWAPVLVAWSDPAELVDLEGNVAGIGGSTRIDGAGGDPTVYVSGIVVLDGPQLADMLGRPGGRDQARAVVLHELGHLVGLDHVEDPTQLMNPVGDRDITTPQDGDVAGLVRLGAGACLAEL